MEYNLKITFGGKSYFAEMDSGNTSEVFTKEKLVESSQFSDWTDDQAAKIREIIGTDAYGTSVPGTDHPGWLDLSGPDLQPDDPDADL